MRNLCLPVAALAALLTLPLQPLQADSASFERAAAWRDLATQQDRVRIRGWRDTWMEALREAREKNAAEVAREGALLEPDAALLQPAPPPGNYLCRTLKLGGRTGDMLDWVAYPRFPCRIEQRGERLSFVRMGGSQRPIGRLFADGPRRMIFLGSMALGDERRALPYGADARRDLAAILERVGERRWRLVFPRPAFESILDVIELVPAS